MRPTRYRVVTTGLAGFEYRFKKLKVTPLASRVAKFEIELEPIDVFASERPKLLTGQFALELVKIEEREVVETEKFVCAV